MLPIAALPVAGILLGVGGSLINIAGLENAPAIYQPLINFVNIPMITIILKIMQGVGDIVFGNLPILFAVGTAVGLAKNDKGTAALASVFGFLIMSYRHITRFWCNTTWSINSIRCANSICTICNYYIRYIYT